MCRTCGKRRNTLPVIAKEGQGKAVLSVYIAAKGILATLHERISFKSGCVVWVAKHLKGD